MASIFLWVIFPYVMGTIMIFGLLYRYAFRQISWAAPSTEIFEKKWLSIGSPLFHWGIVFAFIGHLMGVLIPKRFYEAIGVRDELYHTGAIIGGGIAGLMVVAGLVILLIRRIKFERVRIHATVAEFFSIIALLVVGGLGAYMTIVYNTTVTAYEYRATIGPWFRSLFVFRPKHELMDGVPLLFKVHVIAAFLLFASIPFTRLVHLFSFPARYPVRAPQQYRSRAGYKRIPEK